MLDSFDRWLMRFLNNPYNPIGAALMAALLVVAWLNWEQTRFVLKGLRRNLLRSSLTALAIAVLVFVVALIWSIVDFLNDRTEAKSADFKAIVTEKYQIPSQMPFSHAAVLAEGGAAKPGDARPQDYMTWQFYGGSIEKGKRTRESICFFFCMDPLKLIRRDGRGGYVTMMDGLDELTDDDRARLADACEVMARDKTKVVVGAERLRAMNKKVGERMTIYSMNYKDIDLDLEIIGELPESSGYSQLGIMNCEYLNQSLDDYEKKQKKKHPLADRQLNLVWLRVLDTPTYEKVARQIETAPALSQTPVKVETASSGIASWLDSYRDLLRGMRFFLVPAILFTMALVIANAISIGVRERRVELAVLKVLGFSPNRILALVLAEALVLGCGSGLLSGFLTRFLINDVYGLKFPIAFFGTFRIAEEAPWWGLILGGLTALAGSAVPAWSARSVKVSEVFSKVA